MAAIVPRGGAEAKILPVVASYANSLFSMRPRYNFVGTVALALGDIQ